MSGTPFDSVRDYIDALERRGRLLRLPAMDQDRYEASAFAYRLIERFGIEQAPAFLIERVKTGGRWHDGPVVANAYGRWPDEAVLFGVDPERDTPERLREYAAQMRADPRGWLWLTGDPLAIRQLVGGEFGVYFERVESHPADAHGTGHAHGAADDSYDFVHATVFVLVDGEGTIRAEYHEMLDVDRAMRDITLALREQRADGPLAVLWQAAHLMRAYP